MSTTAKSVVLLSGGLDSTTTLSTAKAEGFEPYAPSFRYGQRHRAEPDAAAMGVAKHGIAGIDWCRFGGSALTSDTAVLKGHSLDKRTGTQGLSLIFSVPLDSI